MLAAKNHIGLLFIMIAGLALSFTAASAVISITFQKDLIRNHILTMKVDEDIKPLIQKSISDFSETNSGIKVEYVNGKAEVVIAPRMISGWKCEKIEINPPLELIGRNRKLTLKEKKIIWVNIRKSGFIFRSPSETAARLMNYLKNKYKRVPDVVLHAVGDIIPGRKVAKKMRDKGVEYPFSAAAPFVSGADIVTGNLECPLSDRYEPQYTGTDFIAPSNTIEGLKMLGLTIVNLANNHSTNYGKETFLDTLDLLERNEIKYTGAGRNYSQAHSCTTVIKKGIRFGFLGYNSIKPSIDAKNHSPGVAWISKDPYYPVNESHFKKVREDIVAAKKKADVLIVWFHWGKEYEYYPSPVTRRLAHLACESGADIVLGSHPHTIQPIEFYKDKLICYSLGNFVFDQMQRSQVREGFILRLNFQGKSLTAIELVPYIIEDYCRPVLFKGDAGQYLIDRVFQISNISLFDK